MRVFLNDQSGVSGLVQNELVSTFKLCMHDLKGNNSSSLMPYCLTLRHLLWIEVKSIW